MFNQNAVRLLIADNDRNLLAADVSFFQRFRSILKKPVLAHARALVWACKRRAQRSFRWCGFWASRRDAGNLFMLGDLRSIRGFEFPEASRALPIILKNQTGDSSERTDSPSPRTKNDLLHTGIPGLTMEYPIIITRQEASHYHGWQPDLPGEHVEGNSYSALAKAANDRVNALHVQCAHLISSPKRT